MVGVKSPAAVMCFESARLKHSKVRRDSVSSLLRIADRGRERECFFIGMECLKTILKKYTVSVYFLINGTTDVVNA